MNFRIFRDLKKYFLFYFNLNNKKKLFSRIDIVADAGKCAYVSRSGDVCMRHLAHRCMCLHVCISG